MSRNKKINLKLIGKNHNDLKVISAYLQDSVVTVKDIVFLKQNRTFIMLVNRFMWEDAEKGVSRKNKRIRCAVKFEEVFAVKSMNINQKKKYEPLECLAINCTLISDEIYVIKIFFAGDSAITINSEVIEVTMEDLNKPWDAKGIPIHKI